MANIEVTFMNERENFLRTLEFRNPHWIPFSVGFAWPVWHKYREDLEELVLRYPKVFGHYKKGSVSFDADPGPCHLPVPKADRSAGRIFQRCPKGDEKMPKQVKAAVMTAPGKIEIQEFPYPKLEPGAMMMKVEMSGICGTDKP